jgi:hypothetical protein
MRDTKNKSSKRETGKEEVAILRRVPDKRILSSMNFYIIFVGFLLLKGTVVEAAPFTISSPTIMQPQMSPVETSVSATSSLEVSSKSMTRPPLSSLPPMSRVTPPPSPHRIELRQRCWNDQGFSVDCAVWTGYRYTWGPATNPYDYWSGAGGSGSGRGGGVANDASSKSQTLRSYMAVLLVLCMSISLSGMVSTV